VVVEQVTDEAIRDRLSLALKGPYRKAQGNALGLETEQRTNLPSPERATEVVRNSELLSRIQDQEDLI